MEPIISNNTSENRYEIHLDNQLVGYADYVQTDQLVTMPHTVIFPGNEGQGLAGKLVRAALDDIRKLDLPVLPTCPYVQNWISKHPEYQDMDYRRAR